ncbi:iron-containing alcohol dehydrogenase [Candidatus Bipolaricaulota bacterium]|nr:iron-containing alcohol dehydrogenase [Candidatus Bipolaricaulota bacterium]
MRTLARRFNLVFGERLAQELNEVAHRPYIVVTMKDIWPLVKDDLSEHLAHVHFVESLEYDVLTATVEKLPAASCVIGVGGGRAIDVAKFFAWKKRLPLFSMQTSTGVNACFTHRAGIRFDGVVKYIGWAVPEAVYVDFGLVANAPQWMNSQGVGEIFCAHTGCYDWKLATKRGKVHQWPYDEELAEEALEVLEDVYANIDEIRKASKKGIETVMKSHWKFGALYHESGWNPRPIEGSEHGFYYNLERVTGGHFQHGEMVCWGIIVSTLLQDNDPEKMENYIRKAGVRLTCSKVGLSWEDVEETLRRLPEYAQIAVDQQIPPHYTILNEATIDGSFLKLLRGKFSG